MRLEAIIIENFRGYMRRQTIPINNITTFVGRNDIDKSIIVTSVCTSTDLTNQYNRTLS